MTAGFKPYVGAAWTSAVCQPPGWSRPHGSPPLWGFPGGSAAKKLPASAGDAGPILGPGRPPGEGNGNPPQCSCLENPVVRGAWRATVPGVSESDTTERLNDNALSVAAVAESGSHLPAGRAPPRVPTSAPTTSVLPHCSLAVTERRALPSPHRTPRVSSAWAPLSRALVRGLPGSPPAPPGPCSLSPPTPPHALSPPQWFSSNRHSTHQLCLHVSLLGDPNLPLFTQHCYCSVAMSRPTPATPRAAARQASLSFTISRSLLRLMSIKSVMPSNRLILCCPLLLPSVFPSIRAFLSKELALPIRWPKYWSFSFSPSNEYSGLISLLALVLLTI